ncbi:MAG TPA: 4-(cytidine 5'-diphospho)-2-C-methyl-D-erythritol kinase [Acidisarcina sp.]
MRSYSKINLGLCIGPPRPDGFHGLATIYQTVALHDVVKVTAVCTSGTPNAISLTSNNQFVPASAKNTAWRMVESALAAMGVTAQVQIDIDKRLPVQGGLGGGSANAVAALIGLEHELAGQVECPPLHDAVRLRLASEIGSDVPLFLVGGTVLGLGRGEDVHPLPDIPATHCVIAAPGVGVSTPQAFRDWDARHPAAQTLTNLATSDKVKGLSRSFAAALTSVPGEPHSSGVFSWREGLAEDPLLALVRTGIENDFEQVVFPKYPLLGDIKRLLAAPASDDPEHAAIYCALSGSGSALFGLYRTEAAAEAAIQRVSTFGAHGTHAITAFRTKTLPRQEYWSSMVSGA